MSSIVIVVASEGCAKEEHKERYVNQRVLSVMSCFVRFSHLEGSRELSQQRQWQQLGSERSPR